jgi:hypothetical protein
MTQPCAAYWKADVVFMGVATEKGAMTPVEGSDGQAFTNKGRVTGFKIEEAFRGVSGATVETIEFGTSCDYGFKVGERYFVYGSLDPKTGKVSVSSCSATKTLDQADGDIAYAHAVARGEQTPSIIGFVTREKRTDATAYRSQFPLEGIRIAIEGARQTVEAKTDEKGVFRVFGLQAGSYRVRALTPPELRLLYGKETIELKVSDGRCSGAGFTVTSLSTISGHVVDAEGSAVKTRVSLVPVDENNKAIPPAEGSIETYTDKEGNYKFDWIAPGRYMIAVNPHSQAGTSDPPYPRAFLPGVLDAAKASVITIVDGQNYEAEDFRLPSPLKERTIEGFVLMPDGSPAIGATAIIEFTDREWMEVVSTDAQGRFAFKAYDGFKYLIAGELRQVGIARHSAPVEVTAGATTEPLKLVISKTGYYTLRYVLRKREKQQ